MEAPDRRRAGFGGGKDAQGDGGGSTNAVGSRDSVLELVDIKGGVDAPKESGGGRRGMTSVSKAGSASLLP